MAAEAVWVGQSHRAPPLEPPREGSLYPALGEGPPASRSQPGRGTESARFVGRAKELATLEALLAMPRVGPTPLVLLHGEAGIGKTSTAAEFARRARGRGAVVLWGTCYEGGVAAPYGPWRDALGAAFEGL